jgi:hypothetical protein
MKHLTAEQKHSILTHYSARRKSETLATILALHDASASRKSVAAWRKRWDGTPQSLQDGVSSGRPRKLSEAQVCRHVAAPIRNSNRAARVVRYSKLLPQVQAATATDVSLRTLQRYGHDEAGARQTRGKKRTADESECTGARDMRRACVVAEC